MQDEDYTFDNIHDEPNYDALTWVHVQNAPYEMISYEDLDDRSLPEIMKLHLSHKSHH